MKLFEIRKVLRTATLAKEDAVVRGLVERVALGNNARRAISRTAVELIRDKITPHNWSAHFGGSGSVLVKAPHLGIDAYRAAPR